MQIVGWIFFALFIPLCILMMFVLCFTYGEYKARTPKNAIKLSFDELKRLYKMAPKKYFLGDSVIQYYLESGNAVQIRLSLIDYLKYSIWTEQLAKKNANDARDANMKAFLESTNKDIEVYKKEAQEYLKSILSDSELHALAKRSSDFENMLRLVNDRNWKVLGERMR